MTDIAKDGEIDSAVYKTLLESPKPFPGKSIGKPCASPTSGRR